MNENKMYIIYNYDGSIKYQKINELVMQGSNNVDKIVVSIIGRETSAWTLSATIKLPDGRTNYATELTQTDTVEVSGTTYTGKVISLTSDYTALPGTIRINLQGLLNGTNQVLVTYSYYLTINEGNGTTDPVIMTQSEYNNLIATIAGYVQIPQTIYKANSYSDLGNYTNWTEGQVFYVLDGGSTYSNHKVLLKRGSSSYELLYDFDNVVLKSGTNVLSANTIIQDANTKKIIDILSNGNHQLYGSFPIVDGITSSSTIAQINALVGDKAVFMISNKPEDVYSFSITNNVYNIVKISYNVLSGLKYQLYGSRSDTTKTLNDIFVAGGGEATSYTIEFSNNKVSSITSGNKGNTTNYPSNKAITDYVDTQDSSLQSQINSLKQRGKLLSNWDCIAGKPVSFPETTPYTYKAGDYFVVSVTVGSVEEFDTTKTYHYGNYVKYQNDLYKCIGISETGAWNPNRWSIISNPKNYKPDGTTYTGSASTAEEQNEVAVGDTYNFDGISTWLLQKNTLPANVALKDQANTYTQNQTFNADIIVGDFDNISDNGGNTLQEALDTKSSVSVSDTGTATDEVQYITIDGVEKKLAGGEAPANMVTTDTDQVITSKKTIKNKALEFSNSSDVVVGKIEHNVTDDTFDITANNVELFIGTNGNKSIYFTQGAGFSQPMYRMDNTSFNSVAGSRDIGNNNELWKDLYLSGSLKDGTNSVAISNIATKTEIETLKANAFKKVDTTTYPTLNDFLASTGEEGFVYLYPIDTTDLTKGYYQYIWENSTWLSIGTTKIDLSGYPTKAGNETITGNWTFSSGLKINDNTSIKVTSENTDVLVFSNPYSLKMVKPIPMDSNQDIGSSSNKWKDLYLSGKTDFGSNCSVYQTYSNLNLQANSNVRITANAIQSSTNNYTDLGTTTYAFKTLYLGTSLILNGTTIKKGSFASTVADTSSTTYSGALASNKDYTFATALTSVTISSLDVQDGDNQPQWAISFIVGSSFAVTLPTGCTWAYGTPTFNQGESYSIVIKKGLVANTYKAYLVRL